MTDQILLSNRQSHLLTTLSSQQVQDLSYSTDVGYPNLAVQHTQITSSPVSIDAAPNGQTITFEIPKSMILRDMMIRSTLSTTTTTMALSQHCGLKLFSSIELRSNNRVILTMTDASIIAKTFELPTSHKLEVQKRATFGILLTEIPSAVSTTKGVAYTPVFGSFFEKVNSYLDTNFLEQLTLVCKLNPSLTSCHLATTTHGSSTLWVWKYQPDSEYYNLLRSRNFNASKPLNMLAWNSYTERSAVTAQTSTITRLNVNYPVFKTVVLLQSLVAGNIGLAPMDTVDFLIGGQKLIETCPRLVQNWTAEKKRGACNFLGLAAYTSTVNYSENRGIVFDWSLEPDNWCSNTGAVSFSKVNVPSINASFTSITIADFELQVVHFYWNIISIDSSNGSLIISSAI